MRLAPGLGLTFASSGICNGVKMFKDSLDSFLELLFLACHAQVAKAAPHPLIGCLSVFRNRIWTITSRIERLKPSRKPLSYTLAAFPDFGFKRIDVRHSIP